MIITKRHPFIAALTCTCCGDGLLVVKSLHHVRDNKPTVQNLDYSGSDEDGNIHLIQNHEYYYQIQTQLGAWNKKYCNVFVYTSQEYYLQRINFNENFSTKLVEVVINFWKKIISQKLLHKNIYTKFYINSSEHKDENKMRTLKWIVECLPLQGFLLKSFFTFMFVFDFFWQTT